MVEWFHERYISRDEHQQVVDYYAKLVAHLHREVRELRAKQADALDGDNISEHGRREAERETCRSSETGSGVQGDNVIHVDFCRRS